MAAKVTVIDRGTGVAMARIVGDSSEMTAMCEPMVVAARALAATHIVTGSYISSFAVDKIPGKKGVMDRAVYNDDPQSHIIEDGHLNIGRDEHGLPTVTFVEGLHILRRVAASAGRL